MEVWSHAIQTFGGALALYALFRIGLAYLMKALRLFKGGEQAVRQMAAPLHWFATALAFHLSVQWILGPTPLAALANQASKDLLAFSLLWLSIRVSGLFFFEYYLKNLRHVFIPDSVQSVFRGVSYTVVLFLMLRYYYGEDIQKPLIAAVAASVFAVIAFNDWLRSAFAGISLTLEDTYKVGDLVQVAGYTGYIVETTWRTTIIRLLSDDYVTIPNVRILQEPITNYVRPVPYHRVSVDVPVNERVRPNLIRPMLAECALATPGILADPPPVVIQSDINPDNAVFSVQFWISDYGQAATIQGILRSALAYRLGREGIHPPFADTAHLDEARLLKTLKEVPLFQLLNPDSLAVLAGLARTVFYGAHERLFRQGDPGDSFFVILSGSVDISIDDGTGGGRDAETVVATIPPGGFFGERSLLTGEPRSAHATAHEDSRMLMVDKKAFQEILASEPTVINRISEFLMEVEQQRSARDARRLEAAEIAAREASRKEMLRKIRRFFELG